MVEWLEKELAHIKSHKPYKRPDKVHDFYKLDSNENIVLEKRLIRAIAMKSLRESDFREYPLEQFDKLFPKAKKRTR